MHPRRAIRPGEKFVRFVVAHDLARRRVPRKGAAELRGQIREDARGAGDVALLDVRDGLAAALDVLEQILHVPAHGGRDVLLQILFRFVFGKFFVLEERRRL